MANIGTTEILLIALVALLLFGAGRIADISKALGGGDIEHFKPPSDNATLILAFVMLSITAVCWFVSLVGRH
jgi:hypothetical protein